MDIQVGDRITYIDDKDKKAVLLIYNNYALQNFKNLYHVKQILKVERTKYEVVEEKRELLTEKEKEIIKLIKQITKNINIVRKMEGSIYFYEGKDEGWKLAIADIKETFKNLREYRDYTFSELGLEDN